MPEIENEETQNAKMAKLAFDTYAIVEQEIEKIMDRKWMDPKSKLILLGGVMINIDGDAPDLFLPIKFAELTQNFRHGHKGHGRSHISVFGGKKPLSKAAKAQEEFLKKKAASFTTKHTAHDRRARRNAFRKKWCWFNGRYTC